jgi:hypothetical protein
VGCRDFHFQLSFIIERRKCHFHAATALRNRILRALPQNQLAVAAEHPSLLIHFASAAAISVIKIRAGVLSFCISPSLHSARRVREREMCIQLIRFENAPPPSVWSAFRSSLAQLKVALRQLHRKLLSQFGILICYQSVKGSAQRKQLFGPVVSERYLSRILTRVLEV